jgi:hemerythrin-like metal-binding protein
MSLYKLLEEINIALHRKINFSPPRIERRNMEIPMTGVYEIDRDHLEIIKLINFADKGKVSKEEFFDFSMSALDYLTRHIRAEEKLMHELDYPGLRVHQLEHQSLRDLVAVYIKPSGDTKRTVDEAIRECREIFRHHIQHHDIPLAQYMKDRKSNA